MTKHAIVVGATGVVGKELVTKLCNDPDYHQVTCLVRRQLDYKSGKLQQHLVDFEQPDSWAELIYADVVFCALGTTLKQAGSKQAQQRIDLDLPVTIANIARQNEVPAFALVSSTGADAHAKSFYLALKGKLEQHLQSLGFNATTIVRPSLLVGDRNEFRLGEEIAIKLLRLFKHFPIIKRYRPITGQQVAAALIHYHKQNDAGLLIKQLDQLFI